VLYFPKPEFNVVIIPLSGILPCFRNHLGRHIDTNNSSTRSNVLSSKETIESSPRAKVEHYVAFLQ
jgi:hypothetical protein